MFIYDWSCFTQKIPIKTSISNVYNLWCVPRKLERWFLRAADFVDHNGQPRDENAYIAAGDTYTWKWHGYPDSVEEKGIVYEANGVDKLRFQFGKAGDVTVSIYKERDTTICELVQTNIPVDEHSKATYHIGCMNGWNFYLTNLKSVIEGGIDLRNKDVNLAKVLNS